MKDKSTLTENNLKAKKEKLRQKIHFLLEAGEVVKKTTALDIKTKVRILKPIIAELNKALKLGDKLFTRKHKQIVSDERYLEIEADANRFKEKHI